MMDKFRLLGADGKVATGHVQDTSGRLQVLSNSGHRMATGAWIGAKRGGERTGLQYAQIQHGTIALA